MGVKYRVDYKSHLNEACRVDLSISSYSDEVIMVRGVQGQACVISYDVSDDPYESICNSKASVTVHNQGQIDVLELQQVSDRDVMMQFYIDGVLKWIGFVIPDGIQQTFQSPPYNLNITATDGLSLLESLPYSHNNLTGGRCILNYFRQILFSSNNLGLMLPIRWVNELKNDAFPLEEDIFSGSVRWSPFGDGFVNYQPIVPGDPLDPIYKSCMYIIDGIVKSMQSRIYQADGRWNIERINDISDGEYSYRETPASLTGFSVSVPVVKNAIKLISGSEDADYRFIEEDAILRNAKALKTVVTTYEQDQRSNILPNGNLDQWLSTAGAPMYWGFLAGTYPTITQVGSLSDAKGSAAKITNISGVPDTVFELTDQYLPIDTDITYTYINFGFKFSLLAGVNVDSNGFITWNNTPFSFILIYDDGAQLYSLNEFGFWTTNIQEIPVSIANLKVGDVAQVDFNARQDIKMPLPAVYPIQRTRAPRIYVGFFVPGNGRQVIYDDIYINVESNSDVWSASFATSTKDTAKEEYTLTISSSHNGFYVSNYMTSFANSGLEKFFSDSKKAGATLTEMNSHAILRNRYKPSLIFDGSIYGKGWSYGEIYNIQTLTDKNFLPLRCSWNTETCTINISAIETRDDAIIPAMKHYGKNDNDKPLSN